jgi:hypothetical protein
MTDIGVTQFPDQYQEFVTTINNWRHNTVANDFIASFNAASKAYGVAHAQGKVTCTTDELRKAYQQLLECIDYLQTHYPNEPSLGVVVPQLQKFVSDVLEMTQTRSVVNNTQDAREPYGTYVATFCFEAMHHVIDTEVLGNSVVEE